MERDGFIYLTVEDIVVIHAAAFGCSLQQAWDRVRGSEGRNGLAGAVGRPAQHANYLGSDLAHQAAVIAHGVSEGQHFVEGNKRTALIALDVFLKANGYGLTAPQRERAQWIIDLSNGLAVEDLAARVRDNMAAQRARRLILPLKHPFKLPP